MSSRIFKQFKYVLSLTLFVSILLVSVPQAFAAYSADELIGLTNEARRQDGVGSLSVNSQLTAAAYAKAQDILDKDYFAHNAPDGKTPWDFINQAGYNYIYAGENLAIGYTDANELFRAWMNSESHRENIVQNNFREIGIAVVSGNFNGSQATVAVQEFGSPATVKSNSAQIANETTPQPTPEATPTIEASALAFIKDKSSFSPKTIFVGEEVEIKATLNEIPSTLEAQIGSEKINLKDGSTIQNTTEEKTYILKEHLKNEQQANVVLVATDKNGKTQQLDLGKIEVKPTIITKESSTAQSNNGFVATVKESVSNNWIVYSLVFVAVGSTIGLYFSSKRVRFANLVNSWRV